MPSLLDLYERFPDNNVVNYYINETKQSWSNKKYYLGGQLPLSANEQITERNIQEVEKKKQSAGIPCNQWEYASTMGHNERWEECKILLSIFRAGK